MRLIYDPKAARTVTSPGEFGRVAVLFGGDSSEREISLLSGNAVLEAGAPFHIANDFQIDITCDGWSGVDN